MGETNCCLQHFDMAGKVILVTGGNKGIGLAIVETLLKQLPEALILLGSRDAGRGEDAVASVKAKLGSGVEGRVKLLLLDVTSQESVDRALESDCPGDRTKALESKGYGTRSEGNWGEYGLSKAAVNCYTIELGKSSFTSRAPAALQAS